MNSQNIQLSKIITNATDTTWSQAYSTLNLYIALSLTSSEKQEEAIASYGKDILERLQREFFALDEKNLETVKKAVETVTEEIGKEYSYSIVLATTSGETLYIIVGSAGTAVIKRGEKLGTIAKGEEDSVTAFSGHLQNDDIIVLETADFAKKIPPDKLSPQLEGATVSEISENIAPLIHDEPTGSEAAIILQYKKEEKTEAVVAPEASEEEKEEVEKEDKSEETDKEEISASQEKGPGIIKSLFSKFRLPSANFGKKRKIIIIIAIFALVAVLAASIFIEKGRQEEKKREQQFTQQIVPLEKKLEDANTLAGLNKSLALDAYSEIKKSIEGVRESYLKGTTQRKKVDAFYSEVSKKVDELGQATTSQNEKVFFDPQKEDIKKIDIVTRKGDALVAANRDGGIVILSGEGKVQKTIKNEFKNIGSITSDKETVYLLSDSGVISANKKKATTEKIIPDVKNTTDVAGIDTFLGNIYVLNKKDATIDKYTSGGTTKKAYFTDKIILNSPVGISIDSSIWIIEDSGKIRKFTKGKEDDFSLKGLVKPLGTGSLLYTDIDYVNIYLLDGKNGRVIQITKNGEVKNQFASKNLINTASFAVDEAGKKVYFVKDSKIYSFDL